MADRIVSQESGIAPYENFFHDLALEALPFFNFYERDEQVNASLELGNQDINEMPRFIKLVWNTAPDLPEQKEAYDKLNPPQKLRSGQGPGLPGTSPSFVVDGIWYLPRQLRFDNFVDIIPMLANADLAPGIIRSVVSLPIAVTNMTPNASSYGIDLDAWYSSPASNGVYITDVHNALLTRGSTYYYLPYVVSQSRGAIVAPHTFVSTGTYISSNDPALPAVGFTAGTAESLRPTVPSQIEDIWGQFASTDVQPRDSNTVRVSFVDTGIGKVVDRSRVDVASDPAHVSSIAATAQVLSSLVAYSEAGQTNAGRRITPRSFEAPATLPSKEYVGYLIEKYELVNGNFVYVDTIGINDPYQDFYYDTKIKYGAVYRYRIRSVIRWVRPKDIGPLGPIKSIKNVFGTTNSYDNVSSLQIAPNIGSYFASEWCKSWATAHVIDTTPPSPPDQLDVRPQSNKGRIVVTFQIPENAQKDIFMMYLWRRVVDANGRDVEPWKQVRSFTMGSPAMYIDEDVSFDPSSADPSVLGFHPAHPFYYVYSATCESVHNGESKMSEQIGARLNREWEAKGEFPSLFFSSRGVDRIYDSGVFSTIPMKLYKTHIVVVPKNTVDDKQPALINLRGQQRSSNGALTGRKYILRLHSLDTGETFDIDFNTSAITTEPYVIDVNSDIYIPSANEQYVYDSSALTSS